MTMTFVMSDILQELDVDQDIDLSGIEDAIDSLSDASAQLVSGSRELADGTGTLLDGINAYTSGVSTLKSGINAYTDGVAQGKKRCGQLYSRCGSGGRRYEAAGR
mgnify:CR=1 FL=1